MLEIVLGNKTVWKVLRLMNESPGRPVSLEEIRGKIRLGFSNLRDSLHKMVYVEILMTKKVGRTRHYYLNEGSRLTKNILALLDLEREHTRHVKPSKMAVLAEFERRVIESVECIKKIILFGSVAKKIETKTSDMDICLITERKLDQRDKLKITRITSDFEKKGCKFQVFDFVEHEFKKMLKEKSKLAVEIERDGIDLTLRDI